MSAVFVLLVSLISVSYSARNTVSCVDSYECQGDTITSNAIECDAYGACDSAKMYSKGLKGYIECGGSMSCNEAGSVEAVKTIVCEGNRACFASMKVRGKAVECSGTQSCLSVPSISSATITQCGGDEACKLSYIESTKVICDSSGSCTSSEIHAEDDIECNGGKACIGSKLSSKKDVKCSGTVSCKRARIWSEKVTFNGNAAGQGSKIYSEIVTGYGYNSLEGAELMVNKNLTTETSSTGTTSTTERSKLKVSLSKSAGQNATIVCDDGVDCDIECTDQCGNDLQVVAFSNSTLKVRSGGKRCKTEEIAEGTEGIINEKCPTIKKSTSECEDYKLRVYLHQRRMEISKLMSLKFTADDDDEQEEEEEDYEVKQIKEENKKRRNNHLNQLNAHGGVQSITSYIKTCDGVHSCATMVFVDENVNCYGKEACLSATINQSSTSDMISCYGTRSCGDAFLYSKGDILCNGKESCAYSQYLNGKNIKCSGRQACAFSVRSISAQSMDCLSTDSCRENAINTKQVTRCSANRACFQTTLTSGNNVFCDGVSSCSEGTIESITGSVKCNGLNSCTLSTVRSNKYVYVDGDQGCDGAYIYSPAVRGYGWKSLTNAIIDSADRSKMVVKFYGDLSGYDAVVLCQSGSTCTVQCLSTGCKEVEFMCLTGSTCKTNPVACSGEGRPTKASGVNCPLITLSTSAEHDRFLLNDVEKKKRRNMNLMAAINVIKYDDDEQDDEFYEDENYIKIKRKNKNKYSRKNLVFYGVLTSLLMIILFYGCYYVYIYKLNNDKDLRFSFNYQHIK